MGYRLEDRTEREEKEALWRSHKRMKLSRIALVRNNSIRSAKLRLKILVEQAKDSDYFTSIKYISKLTESQAKDKEAELISEIRHETREYNRPYYLELLAENRQANQTIGRGYFRR